MKAAPEEGLGEASEVQVEELTLEMVTQSKIQCLDGLATTEVILEEMVGLDHHLCEEDGPQRRRAPQVNAGRR